MLTGTKEANPLTEALTANKRSFHDYTRSANFDNIVKIYESPDKNNDRPNNYRPKCKISLNSKLNYNAEPLASSRSSLYSIPSIEWDGKAKSEFVWRTRSLPRQRITTCEINRVNKLYRTRSHSGFINSYIKDPVPTHYHLPRCQSCGATNNSYAWELTKEEKERKKKPPMSIYLSVDNIPQQCIEESEPFKVKESVVPVFKVEKAEFVESQEFTEDNYLGELGNSFSSENRTVIENSAADSDNTDAKLTQNKIEKETPNVDNGNGEIYRAERARINHVEAEYIETTEGEYHSFTDDFEDAYVSPVKELVEKDIRDYSVPIDFYCDDYMRRNETSPKKSPHKARDVTKTVLEPILEESKSSYGDNSSNLSASDTKRDSDVQDCENTVGVVFDAVITAVEFNSHENIERKLDVITESHESERDLRGLNSKDVKDSTSVAVAGTDTEAKNKNDEDVIQNTNNPEIYEHNDNRKSSIYSVTSSTNELITLDSTAEFEKYEAVSELLVGLLSRIDYECVSREFFVSIDTRNVKILCNNEQDYQVKNEIQNAQETKNVADSDGRDIIQCKDYEYKCFVSTANDEAALTISAPEDEHLREPIRSQESKESLASLEENNDENFSITKLVQDFECDLRLNETILTETSDSGITEPFKIAESLVYYIFGKVIYISNNKNKKKNLKTVVTIVDPEDVLYTAQNIWTNKGNESTGTSIEKNIICDQGGQSEDKLSDTNFKLKYRPIKSNFCVTGIEDEIRNNPIFDYNTSLLGKQEGIDISINAHGYALRNFFCSSVNCLELQQCNEANTKITEVDNDKNIITDVDLKLDNTLEKVKNTSVDKCENLDPVQINEETNEGDLNNNIDESDEQITRDLNLSLSLNDDSSTDDEECKEFSDISTEIAEDIICKLFTNVTFQNINNDNTTHNIESNHILNETFIEHSSDSKINRIFSEPNTCLNENLNATYIEKDRTMNEQSLSEIFIENEDTMNMAFVHTTSSPEKDCKIFESCSESPIRNPNFMGQDLTIPYENEDAVLGSPFVKRAPLISMSQTENSGGIKYWISFDDTFADDTISSRFGDSVTRRVLRKAQGVDEAIPSFYGVNFENNSYQKETLQTVRNRSVLVDNHITNLEELNENGRFKIEKRNEDSEYGVNPNKSSDVLGISTELSNMQSLTSPVTSDFYNTCDSFQELDSPQKKFIYQVHKKQRLYNTWPPFEDTLFYRIISQFRMSDSFDPSDLDTARIGSL